MKPSSTLFSRIRHGVENKNPWLCFRLKNMGGFMIWAIIIGLVIGVMAKFLIPGKDPAGFHHHHDLRSV